MKHNDAISESFKARADSSAFWEAWVGAKLSRQNLYTIHHPFTLAAETGNPVSFYAHTWDLDVFVGDPKGDYGPCTAVEVKSVNLRFTFPNDYPHMGILVCSKASWDKKWPGATEVQRHFLMVSRDTGAVVWLPPGSPIGYKEITDPTRKETYMCVTSEKQYLRSLDDFVAHVKHSDQ